MDNKTLHDRFRHQLTNVHAITVLTVSVIEIVGYIIMVISGVESFSPKNAYLWYGVVFPIVVNVITHLVARAIGENPKVSRKRKNKCIITAALITSFVVAVIHKEYIVTSCAFIFPIVLSAMFNDRKLLNMSFAASVFIHACVGAAFWIEEGITLTTGLNLLILLGFTFVSYLCGILSINFSGQNYITIESQAEQNDKLMDDVQRDQMTGLYNHNAFTNKLDEMIKDHSAENALCLVMVDVDNFKKINDTYGHDCGDTVLIHLAKTIQKHCTQNDSAYRYGGEEFAVIFLGKSTDAVCDIMQNILDEFRSYTFAFTSSPITFSAGVAKYTSETTRDTFFEQADKTLYMAKHEGKNRVLAAPKSAAVR